MSLFGIPSLNVCSFCKLQALDPQEADCCQSVFCRRCIMGMCNNAHPCPNCFKKISTYLNKQADLKIKPFQFKFPSPLKVCTIEKGCLYDNPSHCSECPFDLVYCRMCQKKVQRWEFRSHQCNQLRAKCQYCKMEGITEHHFKLCPEYPIECPNDGCDEEQIPRNQMAGHKRSCPKEIISCKHEGCTKKMKREDQEDHDEEAFVFHQNAQFLQLQNDLLNVKSRLEAIERSNFFQKQCHYIKMKNFNKMKEEDSTWHSPPFYTSPGGYKMCLVVYPNGHGDGKGTHVSCYICLMSGEYDDLLDWPFTGNITVELLNQLSDFLHNMEVIKFTNWPASNKDCNSLGISTFISHAKLSDYSLIYKYLKNDSLYFKVTMQIFSKTKPWLVCRALLPAGTSSGGLNRLSFISGASGGLGGSIGASGGLGSSIGASGGLGSSIGASGGLGSSIGASGGLRISIGASGGLGSSIGASGGLGSSIGASGGLGSSIGASGGLGSSIGASGGLRISIGASGGLGSSVGASDSLGGSAGINTSSGDPLSPSVPDSS